MTAEEQEKQLASFVNKMAHLLIKKGNDYANEDKLSNFKKVAIVCGLSEEQVILVMLATKIVRLSNLIGRDVVVMNEPISDTTVDLSNYSALLSMMIAENKKNNIKTMCHE